MLHLQLYVVARRAAKPVHFDFDDVDARNQVREHVHAGAVGRLSRHGSGLRIGDADRRAGQDAASGVGHNPGDLAELGKARQRRHEHERDDDPG